MGLKGLLDRNGESSDVESERKELRRQRTEAAAEIETLKRTLSERVVAVQQRERELAAALARVEKQEQKLASGDGRGSRLVSVRLRLAEAKQARGTLEARSAELELREAAAAAKEQALAAQFTELAEQRAALGQREESPAEPVVAHAEEHEQHQAALAVDAPDVLERIDAKLAELLAAEQAFARTHAELAKRSDALAEQEAALAAREQALTPKDASPGGDIDALESRIRRLEQSGRKREAEPQTFSAGLRALQERGLRGGRPTDEPLH